MKNNQIDYKDLILRFINSLTLCDHMGDVAGDIETVFERIGFKIEWEDLEDLGPKLDKIGIKTLYDEK